MDIFKKFLDDVCNENPQYKYERVDTLAEIYLQDDAVPIATVEYQRSIGAMVIHFRMGLPLAKVGHLTMCMTLAESNLVFQDDFFIDEEYGYLYGDEGRKAFIEKLQKNIQAQVETDEAEGAFFMSEQPLQVHGMDLRTKIQKMWDEE